MRSGLRELTLKELAALLHEIPQHITTIKFVVKIKEGDVTTTNIIGNQNFGQQIANSITGIQGNVNALLKNKDTEDIGKAIDALTDAINGEAALADENRSELLQQMEFLGDQAATPIEKRKGGLIKPIIDTLSGVCAGVGGLAAAWATWGIVISKFFGF